MIRHLSVFVFALLMCTLPLLCWGTYDLSVTPGNPMLSVVVGNTCSRNITVNNNAAGSNSYSLMNLPASLLEDQKAYYPFNGYFEDLFTLDAGSSLNCSFTADRHGIPNSAINFVGYSYYTARNFGVEGTFGISFWAKPEYNGTVISPGYYNYAQNATYILAPEWGGTGNRAGVGIALNRQGIMVIEHADQYMPCLFSYAADLSAWHHYTVVYSNHAPSVYIDGALVGTGLPSQKAVSYLSHTFGTYVYGSYNGTLDDVCVYNDLPTATQISTIYQQSDRRYRFEPAFGVLAAGSSQTVTAMMTDATLPVGTYEDTIILCQPGDPPQHGSFLATLIVSSVGPKAPEGVHIAKLPDGNYMIDWQWVTQNTLGQPFYPSQYWVYGSSNADQPFYTIIGSTDQNSITIDANALPPQFDRYFFVVKAE